MLKNKLKKKPKRNQSKEREKKEEDGILFLKKKLFGIVVKPN